MFARGGMCFKSVKRGRFEMAAASAEGFQTSNQILSIAVIDLKRQSHKIILSMKNPRRTSFNARISFLNHVVCKHKVS